MKVYKKLLIDALEKSNPEHEYVELDLNELAEYSFINSLAMLEWIRLICEDEEIEDERKLTLLKENCREYKCFRTVD